jgi:hypothetical protein
MKVQQLQLKGVTRVISSHINIWFETSDQFP